MVTEDDPSNTGTWRRLLSTALVGVNRRALPDTPELPATAAGDPAGALLDRAAAATVRQRAGYVPGTAEPMAPAPTETRPVVPEAAQRRLDLLLDQGQSTFGAGEKKWLLAEWLELAAARGMRVPPRALPKVLEVGRFDRALRPGAAVAAGARGRWLAKLNPSWSYVAEYNAPNDRFDPAVWEHGTTSERCRALAALRVAEPARARALLDEVWADEKAKRRRSLLRTLETNLSVDDEALLVRALDDRGPTVRGAALALLAGLPESAHAERLCRYAPHHVWRGEANRGGDRPLRVAAPEPTDPTLARDLALLTTANGKQSSDTRGEWLWALVTHTPLRFWPDHLAASPAEIGTLATTSKEWDLLAALGNAALVQGDTEWARALLPMIEEFHHKPRNRRGQVPGPASLLALLPVDERCSYVAQLMKDGHKASAIGYIGMAGGPHWTQELCDQVVELIDTAASNVRAPNLTQLCFAASFGLPPAMRERFTPVMSQTREEVAQLESTLRFRGEMREEF